MREEIEKCSGPGGVLTKQSLYQMKKMDSFLREVQRLNVPGLGMLCCVLFQLQLPMGTAMLIFRLLVSVNRKVLSPVTLSDGTVLPVNTSIAVAADSVARDGRFWESPEQFDGFRFEKLRKGEAEDNRYQFTSINEESLSFGKLRIPGVHDVSSLVLTYPLPRTRTLGLPRSFFCRC